jgi:hypothetical protein
METLVPTSRLRRPPPATEPLNGSRLRERPEAPPARLERATCGLEVRCGWGQQCSDVPVALAVAGYCHLMRINAMCPNMVGTCPRLGPESHSPCCVVSGIAYEKNPLASTPPAVYSRSPVPLSDGSVASVDARPGNSPESASILRASEDQARPPWTYRDPSIAHRAGASHLDTTHNPSRRNGPDRPCLR